MGNQFAEYSSDRLVLNSWDVVDTAVADTVRQTEKLGLEQYETYVEHRLVNQTVLITDHIKWNNLHLFSCLPVTEKSTKQLQCQLTENSSLLFGHNDHPIDLQLDNNWNVGQCPTWWLCLFNAAKFGTRCREVTLPRRKACWNLQGCPKLLNWSQPLVDQSSPYYEDMWRRYCCLTIFSDCRYVP